MKKRLTLLICLTGILLTVGMLCSPLFSFAKSDIGIQEMPLLQEGDYEIVTYNKMSAKGPLTQSVEEAVYEAYLNVDETINLLLYRVNPDDVGALLSNVINDNPDLFYASSTYWVLDTMTVFGRTYANSVKLYYSMTADEIAAAKEIFSAGVEEALKSVDDSMNDLQKALTIHDYICDRAVYPADIDNNDDEIFHSAYGFFYDNNAVCAGYTLSFSYLMHELGIDCEYVSSEAMQHAWNKIKIDGSWYNIDLTFDNNDFIEGENTVGSVCHHFFMKSDDFFSGEDGLAHKGGKTKDDCTASSTDYDDFFWNGINSRIYVLDGSYYYIKPDYSTDRAYLTKRETDGSEQAIGTYYRAPHFQSTKGLNEVDENNNVITHTVTVDDNLMRLAYLDGRFYISVYANIYSQLLSGERYSICSLGNNYIVGLSERKGEIVYNVYDSETEYKLNKQDYLYNYLSTSKSTYNNYPDVNYDGAVNAKDYVKIIND